jgi:DNA-binding NtrC family response regulator
VLLLATHFARTLGVHLTGRPPALTPASQELVRAYRWPGNVREVQNALQRAVVACVNGRIRPLDFPARVRSAAPAQADGAASAPTLLHPPAAVGPGVSPASDGSLVASPFAAGLPTLAALERWAIAEAMNRTNGNLAEVSRRLGIGRTTLYAKLRLYDLTR